MPTQYDVFDIQISDRFTGGGLIAAGGKAVICLTGVYTLATLYDPDNNFASLSQPVSLSRGKLRFAVARSSAAPVGVDLYGTASSGHGFRYYNAKPGAPSIIRVDTNNPYTALVIPFSYATGTVASEVDSGLDLPVGALVGPFVYIDVKAADATETLDVGVLSTESGGDANGFMAAISVATLGVTRPQWASTATAGALLLESQDTAATNTPRPYEVVDAVSVSWTLSSGSDTGAGRIVLPYMVGVTG